MAETRPGGRIKSIPVEHRGHHPLPSPPGEPDLRAAFEPGPPLPAAEIPPKDFGQKPSYEPKQGEKFTHQTLREGRLMRLGNLDLETDAQTQHDIPAPRKTVVITYIHDQGSIRVDPAYGNVNWRYAPVSTSSNPDLKDKPTWIGWTQDKKGQYTQPLMHPDAPMTLGLEVE